MSGPAFFLLVGAAGEGGGFGWIEQSGEEVHIPTEREQVFGQGQGLKKLNELGLKSVHARDNRSTMGTELMVLLKAEQAKREGRSFNRETDERTRKGGKTESWQDRIMGICEPKGMERRTEEPGFLTEGNEENEENEEKSRIEREFQTGNGQAQRASTGRRGKIIEGKMISGTGSLNVMREA